MKDFKIRAFKSKWKVNLVLLHFDLFMNDVIRIIIQKPYVWHGS